MHKIGLRLAAVGLLPVMGLACTASQRSTHDAPQVIFIAKRANESFHDSIASGVRKEMAALNVHVDIVPGKNQQDVETQKRQLEEVARTKRYAGVLLAPNDSEALIPYVQKLDDAGIPFILIDTPLAASPLSRALTHNCGFVGTDNLHAGRLAAQFIADQTGSGTVFLMRGDHKHRSSIDREKGFVDEMALHPTIRMIGYVQGWWEADAAYVEYRKFLSTTRQKIDAIFAYNDPMALGVSRYYDEHPKLKWPVIVGVDGTLVGQKGVLLRKIDATVVQTPEVMGKVGLRNLLSCIQSGAQKGDDLTPVTLLKASLALERVAD
jgi:ribose transport system substrate-binding protein